MPDRWKPFNDAEVRALIDGLEAFDFEVATHAHGSEPYVSLEHELVAEARRRGMSGYEHPDYDPVPLP